MKFTFALLFILVAIQLASCGLIFYGLYTRPVRRIVYKDSKSKSNYLAIKTITNEMCYYSDVYAEKYENGHKTYQLSYGCSKYTKPGKTTYEYDANGKVIHTIKYAFADSGNDTLSLDETDALVLRLIDSIRSRQVVDSPKCKICTKNITALKRLPE